MWHSGPYIAQILFGHYFASPHATLCLLGHNFASHCLYWCKVVPIILWCELSGASRQWRGGLCPPQLLPGPCPCWANVPVEMIFGAAAAHTCEKIGELLSRAQRPMRGAMAKKTIRRRLSAANEKGGMRVCKGKDDANPIAPSPCEHPHLFSRRQGFCFNMVFGRKEGGFGFDFGFRQPDVCQGSWDNR